MDYNNPDYSAAVRVIDDYMEKLQKNPIMVHDDSVIHGVLAAAAVILPRFRLMCVESVQRVLYDDFKQLGYTFNAFYNETIAFVLDGKRRQSGTGSYASIIQAYLNDITSTMHADDFGSLGAAILNSTFGRSGTVRSMGPVNYSIKPDMRALSYADHELLAQWITRVNGLSDMVTSLSVFLKIARP